MYNERHNRKSGLPALKRPSHPVRMAKDEDPPIIRSVLLSSLIGVIASAVSGGILLTALCFVALGTEDPLALIYPFALLALLPSNFLGGFVSVKKANCSPLACGAVCAAMWLVLSLIISVCLSDPSSAHSLWQSALLHGASVLFFLLGAFAGTYKPRVDARKKHRFGTK